MGRMHPGRRAFAPASLVLLSTLFLAAAGAPPRPVEEVPPPGAGARSDTLFLFAAEGPGSFGSPGTDARGFTFDGPTGEAAPAGWHGVDKTDEGIHWQLASTSICAGTGTDMSPALPFAPGDTLNDFALWCGAADPCWADSLGYGNDWSQWALLDLRGFPVTSQVQVDFAYRSDFEGGSFDCFGVWAERYNDFFDWENVYYNWTTGDRTYRELSLSIPAGTFEDAANPRLAFYFFSDGGWSDEDGSYPSDVGAVWIDNVRVKVDGLEVFAADFEDGLLPDRLSVVSGPPAGDFANLYQGLYQGGIEPVNESFVWACFDSMTSANEAPGYEFGIAWGPPWVNNAIESPPLAADQYGTPLALSPATRVLLQADVYRDLHLDDAIFFAWEVAGIVTPSEACLGGFRSNNTIYYGDPPQWNTWTWDVTDYLWDSVGGEFWRIEAVLPRLIVYDYCRWGLICVQEHRNQAPYFDNVRLMLVEGDLTAAPVVPAALGLSAQPNPFNPTTELRFSAPAGAPVNLSIHDLAGRCVATLLAGPATGGEQRVVWEGRDAAGRALPTGVYLARLEAGAANAAVKLLLIK